MKTPFGDLTVADAHAHFFSHQFFRTLAAGLKSPESFREKLPFEFPPEDPRALAFRWAGELDRHGVARSVLIASVPEDEESVVKSFRNLERVLVTVPAELEVAAVVWARAVVVTEAALPLVETKAGKEASA